MKSSTDITKIEFINIFRLKKSVIPSLESSQSITILIDEFEDVQEEG